MKRILSFLSAARWAVLGPVLTVPAAAAMWLDPNWALIGELEPVVVYDSNLTARRENIEDVYGVLTPKLQLSRRNSATRLEIEAQVERTWFNDFPEFNSTDPSASLLYEFPVRDDDDPATRVDLHWGRDSSTNTDLGRRVSRDLMRGRWDQRLMDTGRTTLDLRVDGRSTDFRESDLNTNEALAVEARVGYAVTPMMRFGLGYGHEWTRSLGGVGRGDTDGEEDRVTARLSGELLPKLRGSVESGVAFVSYDGAVERDDTAWIAAVGLQWEPAPETTASVRASRYTDFSPEGATALRSEVLVDLTRQIGRGFALRGGGGLSRLETFSDGTIDQRSNAMILTAAIIYRLTDRFSAELSERYTRQRSTRDELDYERHVVTGQVNFLF